MNQLIDGMFMAQAVMLQKRIYFALGQVRCARGLGFDSIHCIPL